MSVDIIEIAIDNLTDHVKFEKLASEVMRDEGFHNIKPLGGVEDKGQDAKQESFFLSEARNTLTVFQYTIQERLGCKIDETIYKLAKNKIEYQLLVVVTTHKISSERQDIMIRDARKKYGVNLSIFDRKTLINRLANYENGIFHRHFPDIEKQVKVLTSRKPELSNEDASLLEISMLKAAIAFTFNPSAPGVKKSLFDYLIFALLLKNSDKGIQISKLA
ncbi:MAG: hypothetical protein QME78_14760 [Thermodesulfobacteriota bacterium]|nr:hypothetical protein [Thermodesulfobacteriota bacterium]